MLKALLHFKIFSLADVKIFICYLTGCIFSGVHRQCISPECGPLQRISIPGVCEPHSCVCVVWCVRVGNTAAETHCATAQVLILLILQCHQLVVPV